MKTKQATTTTTTTTTTTEEAVAKEAAAAAKEAAAAAKEAAENAERLVSMEAAKAAAAKAAADKAAEIASKAAAAKAAAAKAAADKAAEIAKAAADKAAADKATIVSDEAVAASTATVICRSLSAYLTSESELAKQVQTLLSAYGGNIERAGALVGRTWRAETAKTGLVIPIRFLVNALQQAGLTIKSARLFAGACDLVSRQAIHKACQAAYHVDKEVKPTADEKSPFDKLLASLAKLENLTQEQADLLTSAIATKLQ